MVRFKAGELVLVNSTWDDVPIYTNQDEDDYFVIRDNMLAIVLGNIGIVENYSMYPLLLTNGKRGWCHHTYIEKT